MGLLVLLSTSRQNQKYLITRVCVCVCVCVSFLLPGSEQHSLRTGNHTDEDACFRGDGVDVFPLLFPRGSAGNHGRCADHHIRRFWEARRRRSWRPRD